MYVTIQVDEWEQKVIQLHNDKESQISQVEELTAEKRELEDKHATLQEGHSVLESRIIELEGMWLFLIVVKYNNSVCYGFLTSGQIAINL